MKVGTLIILVSDNLQTKMLHLPTNPPNLLFGSQSEQGALAHFLVCYLREGSIEKGILSTKIG